MPTILLLDGFRFFFFSNESNEPAHIHVKKGDAEGKIWLMPKIATAYMHGFTQPEERKIAEIIKIYQGLFTNKWNEYFNK